MRSISFPFKYFSWHYTTAIADIFYIAKNYFWSLFRFIPVPTLLRDFFKPILPNILIYQEVNTIEKYIINITTRASGALLRLLLVIVNALVSLLILAVTFIILFSWILLPIFMVVVFISGLTYLFVW